MNSYYRLGCVVQLPHRRLLTFAMQAADDCITIKSSVLWLMRSTDCLLIKRPSTWEVQPTIRAVSAYSAGICSESERFVVWSGAGHDSCRRRHAINAWTESIDDVTLRPKTSQGLWEHSVIRYTSNSPGLIATSPLSAAAAASKRSRANNCEDHFPMYTIMTAMNDAI
jgi:hypothetical protein